MQLDVLCIGEMLVDVIVHREGDGWRLEPKAGGAPANAAVALRRLGRRAGFCGMISRDFWGEWLLSLLAGEGVDHRYVARCDPPTTLAMVRLGEGGEREFSFYREGTADTLLAPEHVPDEALKASRALHLCSVSLSKGPAREATLSAVQRAKAYGAFVSFDVNWRPMLWDDHEKAKELVTGVLRRADFVKMSEEEREWLFPGVPEPELLRHPDRREGALWVITAGAGRRRCSTVERCTKSQVLRWSRWTPPARGTRSAPPSWPGWRRWSLTCRTVRRWRTPCGLPTPAAALCVTRYGAIPAMPRREEVERFLKERE